MCLFHIILTSVLSVCTLLPGSVGNYGLVFVEEGVVHAELVEGPLHPILKRLAGDRLDHRRQQRETVRCVVKLLACVTKR